MFTNPVSCALLVLTIAPLGLAEAADVAAEEKIKFRRIEASEAVDFAPLRSSWGVVRDIDEAVEACLRTGFIEDARVARAGGGKVLTIEPDGTEVEIEIIGGAGGGGSATPVGPMVEGERRAGERPRAATWAETADADADPAAATRRLPRPRDSAVPCHKGDAPTAGR